MTEITYSRKEIDNLTRKLGEFAKAELEDPEWALLLAVFAAAADRVVVSEDTHSGTFAGVEISGTVEGSRVPESRMPGRFVMSSSMPTLPVRSLLKATEIALRHADKHEIEIPENGPYAKQRDLGTEFRMAYRFGIHAIHRSSSPLDSARPA